MLSSMSSASSEVGQCDERPNAAGHDAGGAESIFRLLFERSGDAIIFLDTQKQALVDCNAAAVTLMRAPSKERLLETPAITLAPASQADGRSTSDSLKEITALILANGGQRFEWLARRFDGTEVWLEITASVIPVHEQVLHAIVARDISERKREEEEMRQLKATLERRVSERETELEASEGRLRTLVKLQRAMFQISEATNSAGDLGSLYKRIHQIISGLLAAKNFYIALLDPARELISFPYFVDELAVGTPDPRKTTTGLTGEVLRTGKPLLVTRSMLARKRQVGEAVIIDGVTELPFIEAGRPAACWLGVPLLLGSRALGVMAVQDYRDETIFGEEEKAVLMFIADQTALAIERKDAEEALKLRHREVMTLLDSLPGYAFFKDIQGRYVMANQNFCRAFGQTSQTIFGKMDHELFPAELAVKYRADDVKVLASREPLQVGEEQMLEGGRMLVVQTTKVPVKNDRDEVVGLIGLGFDITERKRAEEELRASAANLRESEARFRSAFYSSPIRTSIARVSDGKFIEVNDAFLEGLELPRTEVIGKSSTDLDIWTSAVDRASFWDDLRRSGIIRQREVTLHNRRGRHYTMLLAADIVEIRGEPHVLVNALDITDRKQAEEELLRALSREKELSELKSNFVSLVSHEFRTPLGVISTSSEILRNYLPELAEVERREHLDSIARNTRRMSDLMEEVLVIGRLDAGKMAFEPASLDLAALCRRLVDEVLSATNRACPINLSLGSLPDDASADARLLRHILTNLLANAVKYSDPGVAVDFTVARDDTEAIFTIRDHGIGIPDIDQKRLFNAFQRGGNVGARHGTGLGLVIVKRCVELHAGKLQLTSKIGEGTVVTVRVPVFQRT
jgi:PAS domain S-box-containing protein